jgi:hypothetical protein
MYVSVAAAFAPALILMYAVLRSYTYPKVERPFFSDPALFGLFAVGLVMGTLLFAAYTWINWLSVFYALVFAAVECMAMVAVLNLKRFHGKSDTVFYGYGLGLGTGCAFATGTVYYLGNAIMGTDGGGVDAGGMICLAAIALAHLLMLSSLGTSIGEGIARLKPMEYGLQAVIINAVFMVILTAAYGCAESEALFYTTVAAGLAVAAACFYLNLRVRLSKVVRDVLRMEGDPRKDVPR